MKIIDKFLIIILLVLLLVTISLLLITNSSNSYIIKGDLNITITIPESSERLDWCEMFPEDPVCLRTCSENGEWVKELFEELR